MLASILPVASAPATMTSAYFRAAPPRDEPESIQGISASQPTLPAGQTRAVHPVVPVPSAATTAQQRQSVTHNGRRRLVYLSPFVNPIPLRRTLSPSRIKGQAAAAKPAKGCRHRPANIVPTARITAHHGQTFVAKLCALQSFAWLAAGPDLRSRHGSA